MRKGVSVLLAMGLALSLCACYGTPSDVSTPAGASTTTTTTAVEQEEQINTLTFTGRVLKVVPEDAAALMKCIGDCPLGDRVWVQYGGVSDVTPQVGQTYTVTYEALVMPSLRIASTIFASVAMEAWSVPGNQRVL